MIVKKLDFWERGKELKVPHYASTAAVRDGNLPQLALNNSHLLLFPTESLFRERIHPLKSNNIIKLSFSFGFTIKFTFINLSSLRAENWLSLKIIILLVYMLIIPNKVPAVIIRK